MRIVIEQRPLADEPTDGCQETIRGTLERPGNVVDFEDHASVSQDQLPGTNGRASPAENDVMSVARLLVLAKHVHYPERILREHIIPGGQIGRKSPGLLVPSVTRGWISLGRVRHQRHENSFRVGTATPNGMLVAPPQSACFGNPGFTSRPASWFPGHSVTVDLANGYGSPAPNASQELNPATT